MTTPGGSPKELNWPAFLALIAMGSAGWFAHHRLVALGTAMLTFSAIVLAPALAYNLASVDQAGDAQPVIPSFVACAVGAVAAKVGRWNLWWARATFLAGACAIGYGGHVASTTTNTSLSAGLIGGGFLFAFAAYGLLAVRTTRGQTVVQSLSAERLVSRQAAAWLGSASFALGSFLVFIDAFR